jgi:hypothetical protein
MLSFNGREERALSSIPPKILQPSPLTSCAPVTALL